MTMCSLSVDNDKYSAISKFKKKVNLGSKVYFRFNLSEKIFLIDRKTATLVKVNLRWQRSVCKICISIRIHQVSLLARYLALFVNWSNYCHSSKSCQNLRLYPKCIDRTLYFHLYSQSHKYCLLILLFHWLWATSYFYKQTISVLTKKSHVCNLDNVINNF